MFLLKPWENVLCDLGNEWVKTFHLIPWTYSLCVNNSLQVNNRKIHTVLLTRLDSRLTLPEWEGKARPVLPMAHWWGRFLLKSLEGNMRKSRGMRAADNVTWVLMMVWRKMWSKQPVCLATNHYSNSLSNSLERSGLRHVIRNRIMHNCNLFGGLYYTMFSISYAWQNWNPRDVLSQYRYILGWECATRSWNPSPYFRP